MNNNFNCRLFKPLYLLASKYNFNILHGIDFHYSRKSLGYLHNTQCHIQFLNLLYNNIELPFDILGKFFTTYCDIHYPPTEIYKDNIGKIEELSDQVKKCKIFCFEICSLKITEMISEIDNKKYVIHSGNIREKK